MAGVDHGTVKPILPSGACGEIRFVLSVRWAILTTRVPLPIIPRMATKLKPLTVKLTKTQIQDQIAECTGLARKQVASVLDCLSDVIEAHLTKNAVGEFVLPGLLKISTVRKPAVKERKGIDPFTKLEKVFKAKPASSAVKVRPLKGLKDMAG